MDHLNYLRSVAEADVAYVDRKDRQYGGSWKRSGGRSAWFMLVRKIDRLREMLRKPEPPHGFALEDLDDAIGPVLADHEPDVTVSQCVIKYLRDVYVSENIFAKIREDASGADGTVLAEVRDLRRYLMLVEAEMMARGVVEATVRASDFVDVKIGSSLLEQSLIPAMNEPLKQAQTHVLSIEELPPQTHAISDPSHSVGWTLPVRKISPVITEPTILDNKIHEPGKEPRPAQGIGADGELLRVGDNVVYSPESDAEQSGVVVDNLPSSNGGIFLAVVRWSDGTKQFMAWNQLRRAPEPKKTRELPQQRTPEDGAQHASLAPHVVRPDYFLRKNVPDDLRDAFWSRRGDLREGVWVLDPHVDHREMPRVLRDFYSVGTNNDWTIKIERVPADARQLFPKIPREQNSTELEWRPAWQQPLYAWDEASGKHVLRPGLEKWAED